ncbi:hemin ABC transporter substrate-binding protein [Maritimibacter sp. DP1N21-5]|uniref:heme/hemin ABC transporter substrate-binding protein n=1 Tax=Maritimibacter sp. DP1N21-5 TaxID=2836867 RepID=UPI001C48D4B3|nr:ABC transporter substrate-binding protein [Maritimibacter sp. DP1N21-5]MBV7407700.1 ABC transporter substrate-binding protein [Maritimibacter sp. DP1N21-5]
MIRPAFLTCAMVLAPLPALADRVLSIGGSVTEIVYALGEGDRLVGRDSTSTWPSAVQELPDVGYIRQLSPEGVLSVAPDLIVSETGAGPVEAVDLLRAAAIPFIEVPDGFTEEAVLAKIRAVASALDVPEKGETLAASVAADLDAAEAVAVRTAPPRVLFILSTAAGRLTAAGENTSAAAIIELAGGVNAVQGVEGYTQLSDEAIMAAEPDVILMMDRTGDHAMEDDELLALPALAPTPAAQSRSVVRMDGLLLLGFGPRVGQAVRELASKLTKASG